MTLTAERVSDYLTTQMNAPAQVTSIVQTFPGLSRQTYIVDAMIGKTAHQFAFRTDPPGGPSCPYPLVREWETYRRLWASTLPVPEPLWFEPTSDLVEGRPLMVRRLVEGSTAVRGLTDPGSAGDAIRQRTALECVEKLAQLHLLDWKALGFDEIMSPPASPREALVQDLEEYRGYWDTMQPYPSPMIEECWAWLAESVPADARRISLVKGNNGVGEEIWRDGRIVAMCDWELATLCDGVTDLAFSQGTLSLWDFAETVKHYGKCVGEDISPHRIAYAHFYIWLKQVTLGSCFMLGKHRAGLTDDVAFLSLGGVTTGINARKVSRCIGRDLVDAFGEVAGTESSTYRALEAL
jgi:aminoglycoside phosphotransferase (APT) family kinase protein